MFEEPNIIVGLEIGTSKICAVVGEQSENGEISIIGLGQSLSRGVRKGEIVSNESVEEDVRTALANAEQMANVEIRSVYLGVTGGHIRGFNNRGVHPVVSADREISEDDVTDVIRNAKAINLPGANAIIHTARQHFFVDGHEGVVDPVGMLGARLEVELHVIHGNTNRLQNAIRLVSGTQIEVEEPAFNGLASALAVLTPEQREMGALVIDIGGGTTEYVAYSNGVIRHSGALAVGGNHISNDIAHGLKLPLSRAEKLKESHGSAIPTPDARGQMLQFTDGHGFHQKPISHEQLQLIMHERIKEIFEIIAHDIESVGYLNAGIFICGGGAHIPRIVELAEKTFQMKVSIGHATGIGGMTAALEAPEFATAIGLVKYGSVRNRKRAGKSIIKNIYENIVGHFTQRTSKA